jgi:hypothetical protein
VSYRVHPHDRRVTSPPWVLECRLLLRLRRCSTAAGHAVTHAQRVVTAPACARTLRRAVTGRAGRGRPGKPRATRAVHRAEPALWPWAMHAVHTGRASAVGVGHARLCNWAERGFGSVAVELVFHFPNIFNFLQIKKFV